MPELERFPATRIVSTPSALNAASLPPDAIALRIAPDELLLLGAVPVPTLHDPHAIIARETSFMGAWLGVDEAMQWLAHHCEWELPRARPAFAQGEIAGLPVKLWLEAQRVLVLVQQPFAVDLEERLA